LGKQYVILENEQDEALLAVYRCMNRGELKRLKRWQAGLTQREVKLASTADIKQSKTPAILELAPIKSTDAKPTQRKVLRKAKTASTQQTDLFEQ
jgi:hypothetical protein